MGKWIAERLRRIADRIDYAGSPKCTGMSFTFEDRKGLVVNWDGRGCRLWYLGSAEYDKAYAEALDAPPRVDWKALDLSGRRR